MLRGGGGSLLVPVSQCAVVAAAGVLGGGGGGGDGDSYCDSEASLDDGSCYDNLEEPLGSPPPDVGVVNSVHQSLDLRHAHHEASNAHHEASNAHLKYTAQIL